MQPIGLLTLTANPTNFFAETEQVAFHVGNLVPGIDVTNDPLLQARLFSYVDTQLTRLGGPELQPDPDQPAARPGQRHAAGRLPPARRALRRRALPAELPRRGLPVPAPAPSDRPFVEVPAVVQESAKVRAQSRSFDDHFSQARLFYRSMSPVEQEHIKGAYAFELAKCYEQVDPRAAAAVPGQHRRGPLRLRRPGSGASRPRARRWSSADVSTECGPVPGRHAVPRDGRKVGDRRRRVDRPGGRGGRRRQAWRHSGCAVRHRAQRRDGR